MSFAGYLFGNVDEEGRLDNDLDEVSKQGQWHMGHLPVPLVGIARVFATCRLWCHVQDFQRGYVWHSPRPRG